MATIMATLVATAVAPAAAADVTRAPAAAPATPALKLLFSDTNDVSNAWGQLQFNVTPVRQLETIEPPGFSAVAFFPSPDGAWATFGQHLTETKPGSEPWLRVVNWKLLSAQTRDGLHYTPRETVLEQTGPWTDHIALARHGDTGEHLLLKLKVDNSGFAYTAFFSPDGRTWREHPDNPLFYDGDAMSLFWSPALHRFVCINKSLQPHRKRIVDHGGPTPSLQDDALRDRRVLMMRTSPDGRRWDPPVSMNDVWNRNRRKQPIATEFLTVPDAQDPPDLEFYSGNAFWYHDRAYMMVLNYAASPLAARGHGPQLDNEWWTSRDGLRWQRPARSVNALEVFPSIPRLESPPLLVRDRILFPRGGLLLGLPSDRITGVAARANAEFSTAPFTMPDADLQLNAAIPSPERPFAKDSSYLLAAALDASGAVIPGFESNQCGLRNQDGLSLPLRWAGRSARELAGRTIRLRFHLRSATVFAVTAQ